MVACEFSRLRIDADEQVGRDSDLLQLLVASRFLDQSVARIDAGPRAINQ